MCETKEYPKQNNIIQLMNEDFRKPNIRKKKALVKRINQAFSAKPGTGEDFIDTPQVGDSQDTVQGT